MLAVHDGADCADAVAAHDVLAGLGAEEVGERDEFGEFVVFAVEDAQKTAAAVCAGAAVVCGDVAELFLLEADVCLRGAADDARSEDHGLVARRHGCELFDEGDVVFAGLVGDVNGTAGDGACGGMETRPGMRGLEHVPIGQDVEVFVEERIVRVAEDVPWVACFNVGEEVVAVARG